MVKGPAISGRGDMEHLGASGSIAHAPHRHRHCTGCWQAPVTHRGIFFGVTWISGGRLHWRAEGAGIAVAATHKAHDTTRLIGILQHTGQGGHRTGEHGEHLQLLCLFQHAGRPAFGFAFVHMPLRDERVYQSK